MNLWSKPKNIAVSIIDFRPTSSQDGLSHFTSKEAIILLMESGEILWNL